MGGWRSCWSSSFCYCRECVPGKISTPVRLILIILLPSLTISGEYVQEQQQELVDSLDHKYGFVPIASPDRSTPPTNSSDSPPPRAQGFRAAEQSRAEQTRGGGGGGLTLTVRHIVVTRSSVRPSVRPVKLYRIH